MAYERFDRYAAAAIQSLIEAHARDDGMNTPSVHRALDENKEFRESIAKTAVTMAREMMRAVHE